MNIYLSPVVREGYDEYYKQGNVLTLNGESFDFSPMREGDTLPLEAISSELFGGNVEYKNGHLEVVVKFSIPPERYSQEQAFPDPMIDVPDGLVALPQPLPPEPEPVEPEMTQDE